MKCTICSIGNKNLRQKIENMLENKNGVLTNDDKAELRDEFPEYIKAIDSITDHDCTLHWNFHQSIGRMAVIDADCVDVPEANENAPESNNPPLKGADNGEPSFSSLTAGIAKDEATVLYEQLNTMSATFMGLDRKIKKFIEAMDSNDPDALATTVINPTIAQFYIEVAGSMRATVKEIREMNKDLNDKHEDPLSGIKALAAALSLRNSGDHHEEKEEDMSTKEFDY